MDEKNTSQEMGLSNLQVPVTPRATGPGGQAPVVEPPLIKALEDRIVELHSVDERWTVLLASWMMAFGCLRYTHTHHSIGAKEIDGGLPALSMPERQTEAQQR